MNTSFNHAAKSVLYDVAGVHLASMLTDALDSDELLSPLVNVPEYGLAKEPFL